jgi:hypothetical protein
MEIKEQSKNDISWCVMSQTKWIVNYLAILEMWPTKADTNLSQTKVEGLEVIGFNFINGNDTFNIMHQRFLVHDGVDHEPHPLKTLRDIHPTMEEGNSF